VTQTAWRITKRQYAAGIGAGIGARDFGGRWNSKGVAVIYAAESKSLAALEQLVHLVKPRILRGFVVASISFDDDQIKRINASDLPARWDNPVAPVALKRFGDAWVAAATHPILAVPSAVVRGEWNYLINPAHRDFPHLLKTKPKSFLYDRRLV
jgi:RES domain-containing protein